jgi:Fe2+ transport system protein FeoA
MLQVDQANVNLFLPGNKLIKTLSQMEQGHMGRILKIRGKPELHRRLLQAGLAVGVIIERCFETSLSDSVEINSNHSHILLDQQAADCIYVELE